MIPLAVLLAAPALALPPDATRQVAEARRVALSRVAEVPECAALFEPLGADGSEVLRALRFRRPEGQREPRLCQHSQALTYPGRETVVLCHGFAGLSRAQAAAALIHEALHVAGLGEAPTVDGAPTSEEITEAVTRLCRLETAGNL